VESISKQERANIRSAVAAAHGIAIAGLHWLLLGPEGLHLFDPSASAVTKPYLEALADFCADIGGEVLVFGSPKQRHFPEQLDRSQAEALAKEALADWARVCHQRGLSLCLEPLTSEETNFIVSAAEAAQLIEEIDEPGLALHLDIRAMLSEKQPIPEIIREHAQYLHHMHVNDAGMIPPGSGDYFLRAHYGCPERRRLHRVPVGRGLRPTGEGASDCSSRECEVLAEFHVA
jgi:D-psicose/D-tagatose/L-ribulose 3-epimerase